MITFLSESAFAIMRNLHTHFGVVIRLQERFSPLTHKCIFKIKLSPPFYVPYICDDRSFTFQQMAEPDRHRSDGCLIRKLSFQSNLGIIRSLHDSFQYFAINFNAGGRKELLFEGGRFTEKRLKHVRCFMYFQIK
jgi:hypothetical protein